jgi:hypothetical protein
MEGLFLAIAAIDIFTQLVEGAQKLYEKYFDVNAALDDYEQKAQQTAQQKLFDTASLETTVALLKQANEEVTELEAKRDAGTGEAIMGVTGFESLSQYTPADSQAEAEKKGQSDALSARQKVLQDQLQETRLKNQAAYDDAVDKGYAKISAHEKDTLAEINQRYQVMKDNEASLAKRAGVDVPTLDTAFNQQKQAEIQHAQQDAAAQRIEIERNTQEQIVSLQNQAIDAGLKGEALYEAQREQAIDAVMRKFQSSEISKQAMLAETAAIEQKYDAEKLNRLQEQYDELRKTQQEAQMQGMTGAGKDIQEGQNKLSQLNEDWQNGKVADPSIYGQKAVAIEQQTDAQILAAHQQFVQELNQLDQRSDDQRLTGNAKIEASTLQLLNKLQADFQKYVGSVDVTNNQGFQLWAQADQEYATKASAIWANSARERQQLEQQNTEQIAQMEAKAAEATLPPWQAALVKIEAQYDERLQKAKQSYDQEYAYFQQILQKYPQYAQQIQAAMAQSWSNYEALRKAQMDAEQAEMQKQLQTTRNQMASQMESLFNDPAKFMEKKAEDLMFQILANWMMQLMQFNSGARGLLGWLFGMGPQMSTSTNPGTALGSVFNPGSGKNWPNGNVLGMPTGMGDLGGNFGTQAMGATLQTAGTTLSTAGTTLSTAGTTLSSSGTTLSSSGTMLSSSATALTQAATALESAASQMEAITAGVGGSGGGGLGISGLGGSGSTSAGDIGLGGAQLDSSADMFEAQQYGAGSGAGGSYWSSEGGGAGGGGGGVFAPSAGEATSGIGPVIPINSGAPSSSPQSIPPNSSQTDSTMTPQGIAGAGIGAAFGAYGMVQDWQNGNTGGAVLTGAMTGASIGSLFGPIGMGIGAAAGALVGWIGSLFGDHGRSKAVAYASSTVDPALTKEEQGYDSGQIGYDQAIKDLEAVMTQAQADTLKMGSGAVSYYNQHIVPSIQAVEADIKRAETAGRGAISVSAAQFHGGGIIGDFGDMWTSPTTGFIHAQLGEGVLTPRQISAITSSTFNSSSSPSRSMLQPASSQGVQLTLSVQAWDARSVAQWLRNGGAQAIQGALNQNVSRYSGVALGS